MECIGRIIDAAFRANEGSLQTVTVWRCLASLEMEIYSRCKQVGEVWGGSAEFLFRACLRARLEAGFVTNLLKETL